MTPNNGVLCPSRRYRRAWSQYRSTPDSGSVLSRMRRLAGTPATVSHAHRCLSALATRSPPPKREWSIASGRTGQAHGPSMPNSEFPGGCDGDVVAGSRAVWTDVACGSMPNSATSCAPLLLGSGKAPFSSRLGDGCLTVGALVAAGVVERSRDAALLLDAGTTVDAEAAGRLAGAGSRGILAVGVR